MAICKGKDLHSALKSDEVRSLSVQGLKMVLQRLQWSKDEIAPHYPETLSKWFSPMARPIQIFFGL
jgi:hypothetical protein